LPVSLFPPDCGQMGPGMPSSRDSFRRNRVAPVGSLYYSAAPEANQMCAGRPAYGPHKFGMHDGGLDSAVEGIERSAGRTIQCENSINKVKLRWPNVGRNLSEIVRTRCHENIFSAKASILQTK